MPECRPAAHGTTIMAAASDRGKRNRSLMAELERERSRIARELHAGAGQPLAGIKINLEMLDGCAASMPESAQYALSRARVLTDAALEQVRAVSHRLHPPQWQCLTTEQALRKLVQSSGLCDRFETAIRIGCLPKEPGYAAKVALYRCAQECIANIFRHSEASRVEFTLAPGADRVKLRVSDNGKGFAAANGTGGIGLETIREHADLLGGSVRIDTGLQGTTITISLPLAEDSAEEED
jgi:signal transduction histidine kinase